MEIELTNNDHLPISIKIYYVLLIIMLIFSHIGTIGYKQNNQCVLILLIIRKKRIVL